MKKFTSLFILLVFTGQFFKVPALQAVPVVAPPITAPTALLLDNSTNQILYSKTPNLKRPPASTTKLLTAIVALRLKNPDDIVKIPQFATTMTPSKVYLHTGEKYRLRDLIYATLINSANDAAVSVAMTTGGSVANFSKEMNKTAKALGCENSNFVNPSGLPDARQYSTVYDMALIMREAQRYPLIMQALRTKTTVIQSTSGRNISLKNHNKMLWRESRQVLGKTGWTQTARHCFVGEISAFGKKVFVAMLGSKKIWKDLKALIDFQFGASFSKTRREVKLVARQNNHKIQLALLKAGYYHGKITGVLGPKTRRAIRKFQKSNKLPVNGKVNAKTWALLKSYL